MARIKDDDVSACDDRREQFWAEYHAAYEVIQANPSALADFEAELESWDSTLADGLESAEDLPDQAQDLT